MEFVELVEAEYGIDREGVFLLTLLLTQPCRLNELYQELQSTKSFKNFSKKSFKHYLERMEGEGYVGRLGRFFSRFYLTRKGLNFLKEKVLVSLSR